MSFAMAAVAVVGGVTKLIMAGKAKKEREAEQKRANEELANMRDKYEKLDTSNPYANLENRFAENVYEDLTVNQQQAEFQREQQEQQRANIMQGLKGAAGGSGIAALAQQMANQGTLQARQSSASIGQQEAANQMAMARGAAGVQQLESAAEITVAGGAAAVQAAEFGRESTLLGMDYGLLAGANQAEQQAMANQMSAMGMKADMYGSQAANNPFSQILNVAGTVAAGWATGGFKQHKI